MITYNSTKHGKYPTTCGQSKERHRTHALCRRLSYICIKREMRGSNIRLIVGCAHFLLIFCCCGSTEGVLNCMWSVRGSASCDVIHSHHHSGVPVCDVFRPSPWPAPSPHHSGVPAYDIFRDSTRTSRRLHTDDRTARRQDGKTARQSTETLCMSDWSTDAHQSIRRHLHTPGGWD